MRWQDSLALALGLGLPTTVAAQQRQGTTPAGGTPVAPPAAAASAGATPALTTTAVPGRQSWFSDRRDFRVGDIVTILVDEYTLTSLDKTVNATDRRNRTLGLGITTPSGGSNYSLNTTNNALSQSRGTDARTNRLTTDMSARVVAIAPNGVMQLKGTKQVAVEKTIVTLELTGWARAQDVTPDNFVQSYRLADAQLEYQAKGPLGKVKGGIIGRIIGALWP